MNKDLMEIHCIKVQKTQETASVVGSVSGSSISVRGTGGGRVSGETKTVHTSHITAFGKTYQLKQTNERLPIAPGDDLVIGCFRDPKTGIYEVGCLINNTNGTRFFEPIQMWRYWFLTAFSFCTIVIFGLGLILFPITLWHALKLQNKIKPVLDELFEKVQSLEGVTDPQKMKSAISTFDFKTLMSGYEQIESVAV